MSQPMLPWTITPGYCELMYVGTAAVILKTHPRTLTPHIPVLNILSAHLTLSLVPLLGSSRLFWRSFYATVPSVLFIKDLNIHLISINLLCNTIIKSILGAARYRLLYPEYWLGERDESSCAESSNMTSMPESLFVFVFNFAPVATMKHISVPLVNQDHLHSQKAIEVHWLAAAFVNWLSYQQGCIYPLIFSRTVCGVGMLLAWHQRWRYVRI